jgi:hypothetical protein
MVAGGVYLITFPGATNSAFVFLGLLLIFGLGAFPLFQLLPLGFRMIGQAFKMLPAVDQRNPKQVIQKYRAARLDGDWGRLYALTAPRAVDGMTVKEFRDAWQRFESVDDVLLPEPALEALKVALDGVRQSVSCQCCGTEKTVHRSGLQWIYKGEDTPVSLLECPDCSATYCRACFGKLNDRKCAQCGADLRARHVGMLYSDRAKLSLRHVSDSKTGQWLYGKTTIKEGSGNAVKLLDMPWEAGILLEDPPAQPAGAKKASSSKPSRYSDFYISTIHFERHLVNLGGRWHMAEALPPTDLTVDWEYIDDGAVAPAVKLAGAEKLRAAL